MNLVRAVVVAGLVVGAVAVTSWLQRPPPAHELPTVLSQMREVARLETLEVTAYKKVSWEAPVPPPTTLPGDVLAWARHTLAPKRGRAIVFATVHVGLDLSRLGPADVRVEGSRIEVALPPPDVRVALRPEETEIVASNLDSAQTAQLLEAGRRALEQDVATDAALKAKGRASAERALRALLTTMGFTSIHFVDRHPPMARLEQDSSPSPGGPHVGAAKRRRWRRTSSTGPHSGAKTSATMAAFASA
ncbi:MAG: DUF4230 domain-containing protein [Myxococcaceae bacterium]|nr:DUF4230 domain-containing protein [Myxococcaceae bacterium]